MKHVVCIVVLLSVLLPAQTLKRGKLVEVDSLMAMALQPEMIKHAGDKGILFGYSDEEGAVRFLSYDGTTNYRYDLSQVPGDLVNPFRTYSDISSDGSTVYVMWTWNPDPHIAVATCTLSRFDLNGHYRDTIKMDGKFDDCYQLSVWDKDRIILTARTLDGNPFIGVYQPNGQFVKKITLPGDVRISHDEKHKRTLDVGDDLSVFKYMAMTTIDDDQQGNFVIQRRSADNVQDSSIPTVIFIIDRNGDVKRFTLPKPTTKYGNVVFLHPFHGHIVVLFAEQNDVSEWAKAVMRVYDYDGKLISENEYIPRDFGFMLLDWTPERALFGTQAGNPRAAVKHFGIIEAIPQ